MAKPAALAMHLAARGAGKTAEAGASRRPRMAVRQGQVARSGTDERLDFGEHGSTPAQRPGDGKQQAAVTDGIELEGADAHARRPQGLGKGTHVGELHSLVLQAVHQQGRRRSSSGKTRRTRILRASRGSEDVLGRGIGRRVEGVGTGKADQPGRAILWPHSRSRQVAGVQRQQRSDVGTSRVTEHEDGAPPLVRCRGQVGAGPCVGARGILDKAWKLYLGVKPVVGNDCRDPARGQGSADEAVGGALAAEPTATVEEDRDWAVAASWAGAGR